MSIKQLKQELQGVEQKKVALLAELAEVQENIQELKCDIERSTPLLDISVQDWTQCQQRKEMWRTFYNMFPERTNIVVSAETVGCAWPYSVPSYSIKAGMKATPEMLRTLADLLEGEK